jgi:hypothetical protein
MIGGAELVGLVEREYIRLFFECRFVCIAYIIVVIEERDLVGVDMPLRYTPPPVESGWRWTGHGRGSRAARQRHNRRRWAAKLRYQIGVASILQGNDRVFLCIGIQVADNEHVSVAAAGGIGRQPVGQGLSSQCAGAVAVALTCSGIVVTGTAARAFALEMIHHNGKAPSAGDFFK